jgi:hypothetical protein
MIDEKSELLDKYLTKVKSLHPLCGLPKYIGNWIHNKNYDILLLTLEQTDSIWTEHQLWVVELLRIPFYGIRNFLNDTSDSVKRNFYDILSDIELPNHKTHLIEGIDPDVLAFFLTVDFDRTIEFIKEH